MQKILLASLVSAAFAMPTVAAEQADVVIIGSGGAGLSAAVTAHDLGKKVIVLEKMAMVGGNTNRAAGGLNAAETKPQAKLGIKDSIESHFNDTIKGGHYLNNPDLDHKLTDNAKYSVDFINDLGGDLNDVGMMAGASQKRAHPVRQAAASSVLKLLELSTRLPKTATSTSVRWLTLRS